jgi:Abnormal spindle-like microcephaly-assoc'd, ASPM-SPD-2-Hydin
MTGSINFGNQAVGTTSATTNVNVTNTGGTAVSVSSVSSSNPTEFAIASSSCAVVNAGASCAVGVTFKPGVAGARSGSLTVVSNGTGSPQAVGLSGTGTTGQTGAPTVTVVEYHHASFDHYFITPVAGEITLLDAHAPPFQDWSRTGRTFKAYVNATAPAGSVAICRFFNDHFAPKSSHFYAAHGSGCETTISLFPDWGLEDDKLFNTMPPDGSGNCPAGTGPVYRLYNQGIGGAPNHRFVTSTADQQAMIAQGFASEGVVMCVPP